MKRHRINVVRCRGIPAFGAWCDGSLKAKDGTILLNVDVCLDDLVDCKGKKVNMNRAMVVMSTLMHEFGHALEEALGVKHSQTRVENITSEFYK